VDQKWQKKTIFTIKTKQTKNSIELLAVFCFSFIPKVLFPPVILHTMGCIIMSWYTAIFAP